MSYYGIDFGGTQLRIGQVNPSDGTLVGTTSATNISTVSSNDQLLTIILQELPAPESITIGVGAAGTVDEENLVIKSSPNSSIKGEITFPRELQQRGFRVVVTNDMKAASQAAARFGEGKGLENVVTATYSSGYNFAVVRKGQNASTAEFGHLVYKPDGDLYCGCSGKGHLEIYVSGNGAAAQARQFFSTTNVRKHPIIDAAIKDFNLNLAHPMIDDSISRSDVFSMAVGAITARHVYQAYRIDPTGEPQRSIRDSQVQAIAHSFGAMVSAVNPVDIIVAMGSQTKDWDVLFVPAIERYHGECYQNPSIPKPRIVRTGLPEIGVQGAVAYCLAKLRE